VKSTSPPTPRQSRGHEPRRTSEARTTGRDLRAGGGIALLPNADAPFLLPSAVRRDPAIEAWFDLTDPFRLMVRPWFERMRKCGTDVRELIHDGCPTACVGDAAFAYVGAFKAHASIGFFHGAWLADPAGLLEGSGKRMRHVKLRPGAAIDEDALTALIDGAYRDVKARLR
jgi:hypothetical protein